jgi:hypothetical protein
MKKCPVCKSVYTNDSFIFCLDDGTPLVTDDSTKYDPNAPTLVFESNVEQPTSLPKVIKRQFYEEKGNRKTEIAYPQIQGLSSEYIQRRINAFLRKKYLGIGDDSLYYEDDERDQEDETQTGYGVTLITHTTLSVRLSTYNEFGGPHPSHHYEAFNIDLRNGYVYTYEDLFRFDSDFKNLIPELVTTSLKKQAEKDGDSYFPFEEREAFDFYLTRRHLVIFNLYYQHAVQMIEAPIKLVDIADVIHSEGPLFPLLES